MHEVGIATLMQQDKRQVLFEGGRWQLSQDQINRLSLDEVAYYSVCAKTDADDITYAIKNTLRLGQKTTITDACACVGGQSMSFVMSGYFATVNSVECDKARAEMLRQNLDLITDNTTQVHVYAEDYTKLIGSLKQDVVFLDPPWGGPGYKFYHKVVLFLGGKHLAEIANDLIEGGTKYVVFRSPQNFDLDYFENCLHKGLYCIALTRLKEMVVYYVHKC